MKSNPPFYRNKYNAVTATYKDVNYHSRREAQVAELLDTLRKASNPATRVVDWKRQVKVPLIVNGVLIANYFCDFLVTYKDGHEEYLECKGFETEVWRLKKKMFEALYPDRTLTIIK